jgi:hypothetical protein
MTRKLGWFFVVLMWCFSTLSGILASAQEVASPSHSGHATEFAISPPIRDLYPSLFLTRELSRSTETLAPPPPSSPFAIGVSVDGLSVSGTFLTPDPNGAAGSTQYVEYVNNQYEVFDKSGNVVQGPTNGNMLWKSMGGTCYTDGNSDVIAQYDKLANVWLMMHRVGRALTTDPYKECFAISQTSDATGAWYLYSFTFTAYNVFPDYPKVGVWPDAYYYSFDNNGGNECAIQRSVMLSGGSGPLFKCFNQGPVTTLPSDFDGTTLPPSGSPDYFVGLDANGNTSPQYLKLFKFHVDWTNLSNSTLTGPTNLSVTSFTEACGNGQNCIPQKGTTGKLDSLGDRLMYRLAYRNIAGIETLVVNHSIRLGVSPNFYTGIRWYVLQDPNGTPTIAQSGTFAPDTNHRWMGSIAMDKAGDMLLGYSESSSTMYPGIYVTGCTAGNISCTMGTEQLVQAGGGYAGAAGGGNWGDYSSMSVDPADDCTFWYVDEYFTAANSGTAAWSTYLASVKFSGCS